MRKQTKNTFLFLSAILTVVMLASCKNKDPSTAKIFVRTPSNQLAADTRVIIIGDVDSNPETLPYVDTLFTNASGFAAFDLADYYDAAGEKENPVAYFDIIAKRGDDIGYGRIRCRVHITSVETVYFEE